MVAGIDVLRAQVELETQRQRVIVTENDFARQQLQLARAIGLPIGQQFTLKDTIPYAPLTALTLEEALARAYRDRPDYQSAQALVQAAEASRKAATGEALPSAQLTADYGDIGPTFGNSHGTFSVVANLRVPIFQGGRVRGRILEADAVLQQRRSELADFKGRIDFEVRTAFVDLKSADDQLQVARSVVDLAGQTLKQAQDRFAAGVAGNIEVIQAQESVATANETYISSLYAHNVAKSNLARVIGVTEEGIKRYLEGVR
jgi:outer membrane protein TolC